MWVVGQWGLRVKERKEGNEGEEGKNDREQRKRSTTL